MSGAFVIAFVVRPYRWYEREYQAGDEATSARKYDARQCGHPPRRGFAPSARADARGVARLDASPVRIDAPSRPLASSARLSACFGGRRASAAPSVGGSAARSASRTGRLGLRLQAGRLDLPRFAGHSRAARVQRREPRLRRRRGFAPQTPTAAGAAWSAGAALRSSAPPGPDRSCWGRSRSGGGGWTPCPILSATPARWPLTLEGTWRYEAFTAQTNCHDRSHRIDGIFEESKARDAALTIGKPLRGQLACMSKQPPRFAGRPQRTSSRRPLPFLRHEPDSEQSGQGRLCHGRCPKSCIARSGMQTPQT